MNRRRHLSVAVIALAAITACKSDEQKYAALRQDALASCLCVEPTCSGYTPTEAQRTACALAQRKLARFMEAR